MFDDGSDGIPSHPLPTNATESRGVILNVDYQNMSVTLGQEFFSPNHVFTGSQGDLQLLSNGNSFIGWGLPYFGEVLFSPFLLLMDSGLLTGIACSMSNSGTLPTRIGFSERNGRVIRKNPQRYMPKERPRDKMSLFTSRGTVQRR